MCSLDANASRKFSFEDDQRVVVESKSVVSRTRLEKLAELFHIVRRDESMKPYFNNRIPICVLCIIIHLSPPTL